MIVVAVGQQEEIDLIGRHAGGFQVEQQQIAAASAAGVDQRRTTGDGDQIDRRIVGVRQPGAADLVNLGSDAADARTHRFIVGTKSALKRWNAGGLGGCIEFSPGHGEGHHLGQRVGADGEHDQPVEAERDAAAVR